MSFFHGIRTVKVPTTGGVINLVPSAVVALIGSSPFGPVNTLTLCNNASDDAQFGPATPDNNIAKTLSIIRATVKAKSNQPSDGSCPVLVVNVYNSVTHAVVGSKTFTPDATTGAAAIGVTWATSNLGSLHITKTTGGTAVNVAAGGTYIYGTDYTMDAYGNFVDITGTYKNVSLSIAGTYFHAAGVVAADIIGASSPRTGIYLFDLAYGMFGFKPKIFLCPTYNTLTGVAAALESEAGEFAGAVFLSDCADGVSVSTASGYRSTGIFTTSAMQTICLYPWLQTYDNYAAANTDYPYAAFMAGMLVANDMNVGAWQSPSNQELPPLVVGVAEVISCGYFNSGSDANSLNAAGIVTYNKKYGANYSTWGNNNASFPTNTDPLSFIGVYRMDGLVTDSMEQAAEPYVDQPINNALIDIMKQAGQDFLNELIQAGGVLPGSTITYDPALNPASQLATGYIKFTRNYMVPTPAGIIEFEDVLDIALFNNLG
jgi:phage tail sheath protein FI